MMLTSSMDASSFRRGFECTTTLAHRDAVGRRRPLHHFCTAALVHNLAAIDTTTLSEAPVVSARWCG